MGFHAIKHFKTITHHKILVAKGCFRVGLYRQGLLHDMSKYSPSWVVNIIRVSDAPMTRNGGRRAIPPPGSTTRAETSIISTTGSITVSTSRDIRLRACRCHGVMWRRC